MQKLSAGGSFFVPHKITNQNQSQNSSWEPALSSIHQSSPVTTKTAPFCTNAHIVEANTHSTGALLTHGDDRKYRSPNLAQVTSKPNQALIQGQLSTTDFGAALSLLGPHGGMPLGNFDCPTSLSMVDSLVNLTLLAKLIEGHPKAEYLIQGFQQGFKFHFEGQEGELSSKNSVTANVNSNAVDQKIQEELTAGRIAGPFQTPPFRNFKCSPSGRNQNQGNTDSSTTCHFLMMTLQLTGALAAHTNLSPIRPSVWQLDSSTSWDKDVSWLNQTSCQPSGWFRYIHPSTISWDLNGEVYIIMINSLLWD